MNYTMNAAGTSYTSRTVATTFSTLYKLEYNTLQNLEALYSTATDLNIATYQGGTWSRQSLSLNAAGVTEADMIYDASGNLIVSYMTATGLFVKKRTGGVWTTIYQKTPLSTNRLSLVKIGGVVYLIFMDGKTVLKLNLQTAPSTIYVTNTNDSGYGSLREAINCANSTVGANTIKFNISGSIPHKILLTTATDANSNLPTITDANTSIDASQGNNLGDIVIESPFAGSIIYSTAVATTIKGIVFKGTVSNSDCIRFDSNDGLIQNNSITSVGGGIAFFTGSNNSAINNTIFDCPYNGIQSYGGGGNNFISKNTIYGCRDGVTNGGSGTTSKNKISQNSFYCNGSAISFTTGGFRYAPPFNIVATISNIAGKANANDSIEVFYNDNTGCSTYPCQGKTYIGTTVADASGNWTLNSTLISGSQVTATAMDAQKNTSPFAACASAPISCRVQDSLALIDLYNATNGANWTNKWILSQPMTTWYGIKLNANGCVECIDMDGTVDCQISNTVLTNNLVGTLPNFTFAELKALVLTKNQLSGSLPNFNLPKIQILELSNNLLTGSIPNFDKMPNLARIQMISNQFSGTIPNFDLPNLTELYLFQNKLSGTIPLFDKLPKLVSLDLLSNQLSGAIPNFTLPDLANLSLYNNQLSGSIPNFNLLNLVTLYLGTNRLIGTIPNFNLPKLQDLDLSANQLTGSIPNFTLPKLQTLNFISNQLSGSIPNFNLPILKTLQLASNQLTGSIPNFNLANLEHLNLYTNQLTGSIPSFSLPKLYYLTLANNQLSGDVPIFNTPVLASIYVINNKLTSLPNFNYITTWNDRTPNVNNGITSFVFSVKANSLTFKDIIPNMPIINTWATKADYALQDSIFKDTTYQNTEGSNLTIDLGIDGAITDNSYKWFKNGVLYRTTTTNKLPLSNLQLTDAGIYTCQVTNPRAPLLTLYSRKATVLVSQSCRSRDSLALVALYNATGGANWTVRDTNSQKSPWILSNQISTWFGVTLSTSGCVTCLDLDGHSSCTQFANGGNNLVGTLPSSLDSLKELQNLFLTDNKLSGVIPNLNLPNLNQIWAYNNQLSGVIPNFNLPKLTGLYLAGNQLSGIIPNFNLTNLGLLNLNGNQLTTLPNFNLPNLVTLLVGNNKLVGSIPNFNLPKLETLYFYSNQLSGPIPNFNNLPNLQQLFLEINNLDGTVPNFNLSNLKLLHIYQNNLSGVMPNFNLPNLQQFIFFRNKIDSCPRFSNLPALKKDTSYFRGLHSETNRLTFDDILPNIGFVTTASFGYTPQDSIYKDTTINLTTGSTLTIDLAIDGALTTNKYVWFKNGIRFDSSNQNKLILRGVAPCDAGTYTVQVTNPAAPLLTLFSRKAKVIVSGSTATLSTNVAICNGLTYRLPSGRVVAVAGTYADTLRNIRNCDSFIVTTRLTIGPASTTSRQTPVLCNGQTYTLPNGQVVNTATNFRDTVRNQNGCDSLIRIVTVTTGTNPTVASLNPSICRGQNYTLPNGQVVTPLVTTTYTDTLKSRSGCDSLIRKTVVNVNLFTVLPAQNTTICRGQTYSLPSGRMVSVAGTYQDTFRNAAGCDNIVAITLTVNSTAPKALDDTYTLPQGQTSIDMNVISNDIIRQLGLVSPLKQPSRGQLTYINNGVFRYTAPNITSGGAVTYDYRVCDNTCPTLCDSATVSITLSQTLSRNIPVGITPNGDGANDVLDFNDLGINTTQYPDNEITIVNRWSQIVYQSRHYDNNWAGNNQDGKPLPAGTYYYIFRLNLADGKIITGDITIVR